MIEYVCSNVKYSVNDDIHIKSYFFGPVILQIVGRLLEWWSFTSFVLNLVKQIEVLGTRIQDHRGSHLGPPSDKTHTRYSFT